MTKQLSTALLWLIVVIIALPQLTETIYSPSLPEIAKALSVDESWVEFTLTIYLLGFAVGSLFWGKLSDYKGRKPCLLMGLFIYILGCVGCYFSTSIEMLLFSRFVQAFGGSVGSVLVQAICRDSFEGVALGKVYSVLGSAIAFTPAIGPVLGGVLAEHFGWNAIFLVLIGFGSLLLLISSITLHETHPIENRVSHSLVGVLNRLIKDQKVLSFAFIVGAGNGIAFSYYAEGSFYLIDQLGLTPSQYGSSFIGIAVIGAIGGMVSRKLQEKYSSLSILYRGLMILLAGTTLFSVLTILFSFMSLPGIYNIALTLASMIIIMTGIGMVLPNALSLALKDYRDAIGTASSLMGFGYYIIVSLCTLGMALLHNDTLFPMPLYFLVIACSMFIVFKVVLKERDPSSG